MLWFELFTWVTAGATAGLWWVWFRKRHRHLLEMTIVGVAGGVLGGGLAHAITAGVGLVTISGYDVVALLGAILGAAALISVDVRARHPREAAQP